MYFETNVRLGEHLVCQPGEDQSQSPADYLEKEVATGAEEVVLPRRVGVLDDDVAIDETVVGGTKHACATEDTERYLNR